MEHRCDDLDFVSVLAYACRFMSGSLLDNIAAWTPLSDEKVSTVRLYFGSVSTTRLTLYQSAGGGIAWMSVYWALANSEPDRDARALARRKRKREDADALTSLILS